MYVLLLVSIIGFIVFHPSDTVVWEYISAVFSVSLCIILPATFFVVASSVMLPELVDIRLVYLVYSVLFFINALPAIRPNPSHFTFSHKAIWQS